MLACLRPRAQAEWSIAKIDCGNLMHPAGPGKEKIQYLWLTDGSDDGTPDLLKKYDRLEVYHLDERRGKMHAMNRGVKFVKAPIIIFSDTNTILGKQSVREIVAKFSNSKTGCVAGEKRIVEKR